MRAISPHGIQKQGTIDTYVNINFHCKQLTALLSLLETKQANALIHHGRLLHSFILRHVTFELSFALRAYLDSVYPASPERIMLIF